MRLRLEIRDRTPAWMNLALPLVAVLATLVLCAGLVALAGAGALAWARERRGDEVTPP